MIAHRRESLSRLFAAIIPLVLGACATEADRKIAESCTASGGRWIADTRECEIGKADWCKAYSGTFNKCASACRNTRQEVCITVCVPVCKVPDQG